MTGARAGRPPPLAAKNKMKKKLTLFLILLATVLSGAAEPAAKPSVFDLVGNWESTIEFGKTRFRLTVTVAKSADGKLSGKINIPDQGAKDIPVSAMLCNYPAVRWEIDPFDTAFSGTINAETNQISGAFEEGPGGRPMPVVFRRISSSATEEPKRVYTFAPGEERDVRGYWKATVDSPPGAGSRIGLKIGRGPDGTFGVLLDMLDRGTLDIAASTVGCTNSAVKFEWQLFQIVFEGNLNEAGNKLTGIWKQGGKPTPVNFERLAQPATALPENLSFTPENNDDPRGYWKGALEVQGNKLRLVLKIGRTQDGMLAGTLASLDQGGGEMPMTTGNVTNSVVKLEWKTIHGVFKGSLNKEGTVLDGTWEQMGPPLALKLERTSAAEAKGTH
jgi:hypothetical protein